VLETPQPDPAQVAQAAEYLRPVWSALGWTELPPPAKWCEDFAAQFESSAGFAAGGGKFYFRHLSEEQIKDYMMREFWWWGPLPMWLRR
jgi:nitronate monooxygenase